MLEAETPVSAQASFFEAHNLTFPTTFVGRQKELDDIARLLSKPECRLLTIIGSGGIGKTRLAIETAKREQSRYRDGVYWVDLQAGHSAAFLLRSISTALRLAESDNPRQRILDYLRDKSILLALDNCEQLQESGTSGITDFLSELVGQGEGVRILATSRAALRLQEEWLYPVSGLAYPDPTQNLDPSESAAYSAVALFIERVRRVRPQFSVEGEEWPTCHDQKNEEYAHIARICRAVEGMPLALELAASWARGMSCGQIAAEIERNQADFLTSRVRNIPERHRSMQAVFMQSWSRLSAEERAAFRQLAVFRGGFSQEAAREVALTTLPVLASLVDKSLVRGHANGRYDIHEVLRQFAETRLKQSPGEDAGVEWPTCHGRNPEWPTCHGRNPEWPMRHYQNVRARHAAYFTEFLHVRSEALLGGRQREAADEIAPEFENIRLAWQWNIETENIEALGQALDPLDMFCHIKGRYHDIVALCTQAMQALAPIDGLRRRVAGHMLTELGWALIRLGEFERAERLLNEAEAIYEGLDREYPASLGTDPALGLSTLASIDGDYARAERLARRGEQDADEHGRLHNLQNARYQLANIAYAQGRYEEAYAYAQAAYAVCEQTGDRWFMAYCLGEMGQAMAALGDYEAARRYYSAGYEVRKEFSDPGGMALARQNLGEIALRQGEYDGAYVYFEESARIYRTIGDRGGVAEAYLGLGKTELARQEYAAARARLGQALDIAVEIQYRPLLLSILAAIGAYFIETNRLPLGLSLLAHVQYDSAANHELRTIAARQRAEYEGSTDGDAFAAASQPVGDGDFAMLMARVRSELAAIASPQRDSPNWDSPQPQISRPSSPSPLIEPLTQREEEVLHLLAQGLSNHQIAEHLSVVVGTVKAHNNSIFGKLGVKNRVQAVIRARELNLL